MGRAVEITVSDRQRGILEKWVLNKAGTPYRLVERCRIILLSAEGLSNTEQGRRLDVDRQRARRRRTRWASNEERLAAAEQEGATDKDLAKLLSSLLEDDGRSGTPSKFTAEQLTQIIAVACELPEESDRPVTHWTPSELADEVKQRGIVESISPRHVDRVLKRGISAHTRASTG
jgi:transposase